MKKIILIALFLIYLLFFPLSGKALNTPPATNGESIIEQQKAILIQMINLILKQIQYLQEQLNILIAQQNSQTTTPNPSSQQDSQTTTPQITPQDVFQPATTTSQPSTSTTTWRGSPVEEPPILIFGIPKEEFLATYHRCGESPNDKFIGEPGQCSEWCNENGKSIYKFRSCHSPYGPPAQP